MYSHAQPTPYNNTTNYPTDVWHRYERRKRHKESKLIKHNKPEWFGSIRKKKPHTIRYKKSRKDKHNIITINPIEYNDITYEIPTKWYKDISCTCYYTGYCDCDVDPYWELEDEYELISVEHKQPNYYVNLINHIKKLIRSLNIYELEHNIKKHYKILCFNGCNTIILKLLYEHGLYQYMGFFINDQIPQQKFIQDIMLEHYYYQCPEYFRFATRESQLKYINKSTRNVASLAATDRTYLYKYIKQHKTLKFIKYVLEYKLYEYNNPHKINTLGLAMNEDISCAIKLCNDNTPKKYINQLYKYLHQFEFDNDLDTSRQQTILNKLKQYYCDYYRYFNTKHVTELNYYDTMSITTKCIYIILKYQYRYTKKIVCKLIFYYLINNK